MKKTIYQSPDVSVYYLTFENALLSATDNDDNGEMHNGGFLDE